MDISATDNILINPNTISHVSDSTILDTAHDFHYSDNANNTLPNINNVTLNLDYYYNNSNDEYKCEFIHTTFI